MATLESIYLFLCPNRAIQANPLPLYWIFILYLTVDVVVQLIFWNKRGLVKSRLILSNEDILFAKEWLNEIVREFRMIFRQEQHTSLNSDCQNWFEKWVVRNLTGSQIKQPGDFWQIIENSSWTLLSLDTVPHPIYLLTHRLACPLLVHENRRLLTRRPALPDQIHQVLLNWLKLHRLFREVLHPIQGRLWIIFALRAAISFGSKPILIYFW